MNSYYIESYGCQMNLADTESISSILSSAGMLAVQRPEAADIIIVNTCVVRETAVSRVKANINRFKSLKAKKGFLKIVVAGCLAQHEKEDLFKQMPIVDYIVGPDQYHMLPHLSVNRAVHVEMEDGHRHFYTDFKPNRKEGVNAWIPIMRGCNNYCAYCIVPYVRGREASKPVETILNEIKQAVDEGFVEVTLLGQNVNSYKSGSVDLPELLGRIDNISGLKRVRFMTSHPKDLSDELIHCFGSLKTLCEYLHLPVQSGANPVLKRMNRKYTRESYLETISKLRDRVGDLALSTDILCGFPGETKQDHQQTVTLIKEVEFDAAFMFIYSKRTGTKAAGFNETLSHQEKVERVNEVIGLQMEITKKRNSQYTGKQVEVLVEGLSPRDKNFVTARTRTFKNVIFRGDQSYMGRILKVKITGSSGWALHGALIE